MKQLVWVAGFLLTLLFGCQKAKTSELQLIKPVQSELKDDFTNAARSIDIQDGMGKAASACLVDKEGTLSCYSSGAYSANFSAFRNIGALRDFNDNCAVNQYGAVSCVLPAKQELVRAPLVNENIQNLNFSGPNEPCVLLKSTKGNYVKCYGDEFPLGEMLFADRILQLPGATLPEVNPVVAYAQTRIGGTGDRIVCSLLASGTASCKNITKKGPELDRPGDKAYVSLALNHDFKCLVDTKGQMTCETHDGQPAFYPIGVKTTKVVEVTGQDKTMCARYQDGNLACWTGSLVTDRRRFNTAQKAMKIEANRFGICALFADERLHCLEPQSGNLVAYSELKADHLITNKDALDPQTCATGAGGKLACWGGLNNPEPPKGISLQKEGALALGRRHLCYRQEGVVSCQGQTVPDSLIGSFIVKVVAAHNHSCALSQSGSVYCWGQDLMGETNVPANLPPIKELTTALYATCGIDASNKLHCWGKTDLTQVPQELIAVKEVAIGDAHACALDLKGQPNCWGDQTDGKIMPVNAPAGLKKLVAGAKHTCALDAFDEAPLCWGNNDEGQIEVPPSLEKAKTLALGATHSCAIDARSKVVCWGNKRATDMNNRFEKNNGFLPLQYVGDLFRAPSATQDLEVCADGVCQLPDEAVVSFDGANIGSNPRSNRYSFWLHYQSSCPNLQLQWILNGRFTPEKTYTVSGGREAGPEDTERLAKFYQAPIVDFTQGALNGPALLQVRIVNADKTLTRTLPQGCHVRIKTPAIQLADSTSDDWETAAGNLVESLKNSVEGYLNFKTVTEGLQTAWQTNALSLHTELLSSYTQQVMNAIDVSRSAGFEIKEVPEFIDEDGLRGLLMTPDQLPLYSGGGTSKIIDSFAPLAPPPEWYYPAIWNTTLNEQVTLEKTLLAYVNLRTLLTSAYDADASGKIRRRALTLGLSSVNKDLSKARTFIRTAETLRTQIQTLSGSAVASIVGSLQGKLKSATTAVQNNK